MGVEPVKPESDEERLLLGRWIKKGRGLIISTSPMGESYIDPKVKREGEVARLSDEFHKMDLEVAQRVPHLKGKFRYEVEQYFRDHWGPYLPKE
jgi:hypothetical protein